MNKKNQAGKAFDCAPHKDTILAQIRQQVIKGTGMSIAELRKLSDEAAFILALKHVCTTKKALCFAIGLPIDSMCRRKRDYEKINLLWVHKKDRCPVTGEYGVQYITTDERLKPNNKQGTFDFEGGPGL